MFRLLVATSLLHVALSASCVAQSAPTSLLPPKTARLAQSASVVLRYRLGSNAPRAVIQVTDLDGGNIRILPGVATAGAHEVLWDMRYADSGGPVVPPGKYRITLTVGARSISQPLRVLGTSMGREKTPDLIARYKLLVQIHDKLSLIEPAIVKGDAMLKNESKPTGNSFSTWYSRMENALDDPKGLRYCVTVLNALAKKVGSEKGAPSKADLDTFSNLQETLGMHYQLYYEIVHPG